MTKEQRTYDGERIVSSINDVGKTTATCKKMKLHNYLSPHTKINSEWINDLNVRPETIILGKNIGRMLFDISFSNILLDMSPQEGEKKAKINKWDYIKLKRFCTTKETINKPKRQPTQWEKISINHLSDID